MDETDAVTTASESAPAPKAQTPTAEAVEIAKTVIYALLIALVIRVLLFQPFTIPSASMEPNLLQGDYIIVTKFAYGISRHSIPFSPPLFHGRIFNQAPKRGDIIVFKLPRDGHTDYIKRLIGLPGDRVQVRNGAVYVNGKVLPRQDVGATLIHSDGFPQSAEIFRETNPEGRSYTTYDLGPVAADDTDVFVVPAKHYFFMGDNRDNSLDSRFPKSEGVGYVPEENLVGKAEIILLSWNDKASIFKPWTWFLDARPSRFFHLLK